MSVPVRSVVEPVIASRPPTVVGVYMYTCSCRGTCGQAVARTWTPSSSRTGPARGSQSHTLSEDSGWVGFGQRAGGEGGFGG